MEQDLEVDRVTKRYGPHTAVDALSLAVAHGSFFSILGPSGCGKTTLLRIVAGFSHRTRAMSDRRSLDARRRAEPATGEHGVPAPGAVPADVRWRERRLRPRAPRRGECGDRQPRRRHARTRVGLPGAQHKRVDQLSGGQKQRVAIARSLVLEPTLLLLDEPLGALDLKLREHMKIELKQLQADFGTTFVYITHDQSEALVLSDRVAVMNAGRFEQVGTPQELYYQPRTPFVAGFVGANNRFAGSAVRSDGGIVELLTADGLAVRARASGSIAAGDPVEAFMRPEVIDLARDASELPSTAQRFSGRVQSLLFDGANSAVLVREETTRAEIRIALPQTGRFADLGVDERVTFGVDPQRAVCFRAGNHGG